MALLAAALFVVTFAFGDQVVGWSDPDAHIKIALVASFLFGMVTGLGARS